MEEKFDLIVKFLEVAKSMKHPRDKNTENAPQKEEKDGQDNKVNGRQKVSITTVNILCLLLKKEVLNQRNIAKLIHVSPQAVSETIKKLFHEEFITKKQGALNNENIILLTEKGKEFAIKLEKRFELLANDVFADFSDDEIKLFYHFLEKMR